MSESTKPHEPPMMQTRRQVVAAQDGTPTAGIPSKYFSQSHNRRAVPNPRRHVESIPRSFASTSTRPLT
jgi:hypothetical protein